MDVIVYVVCCFEDFNVVYVVGWVDFFDDIEIINIELILVDFVGLEKCV